MDFDEFLLKRNANIPKSALSVLIGIEERLMWERILEEIRRIDYEWYRCETCGDIYTFKIRSGGWYLPYCGGVDVTVIPSKRLIMTDRLVYRSAKYASTFINHVLDIALYLTQERTGAVGLNYLDLAAAPFIAKDCRDEHSVKQIVEELIYNMNKPLRYVYQSMFVNILIGLSCGEDVIKNVDLYIEGRRVGTGLDYVEHGMRFLRHMLEILLRGDAYGRPFTFPLPSIYLTRSFIKLLDEYDMRDLFWKNIAYRGTFYMMNPRASPPGDAFSFCCRLRIDSAKLRKVAVGRWMILTGSIGYVGINMPRIAYTSHGDLEKAIETALERVELCRRILKHLRERYVRLYRMGMYPMTAWLIDDYGKFIGDPFRTYFSTIATIGFAEYLSIMYLENNDSEEVRKLAKTPLPELDNTPHISAWNIPDRSVLREMLSIAVRTLRSIKERIIEMSEEDDVLYNLEQAPAEEAGVKLALRDWETFRDMRKYIPRDVDPLSGEVYMYYTSQTVPYYSILPLWEKVWFEDSLCRCRIRGEQLYDGGYVMFIHAPMFIEPEKVEKLCMHIVENTEIIYFSYKPVQTVCRDCMTALPGVYDTCPICGGKNIEKWDRIVGYYTPISNWNPGRRAEFNTRIRRRVLS